MLVITNAQKRARVMLSRVLRGSGSYYGMDVVVMDPLREEFLQTVPPGSRSSTKACHPGMSVASWAILSLLPRECAVRGGMTA